MENHNLLSFGKYKVYQQILVYFYWSQVTYQTITLYPQRQSISPSNVTFTFNQLSRVDGIKELKDINAYMSSGTTEFHDYNISIIISGNTVTISGLPSGFTYYSGFTCTAFMIN